MPSLITIFLFKKKQGLKNWIYLFRGFKTVGPFVVMIYRMLKGDLIRFVSIYLVFVMGFSQGIQIKYILLNPKMYPMK